MLKLHLVDLLSTYNHTINAATKTLTDRTDGV